MARVILQYKYDAIIVLKTLLITTMLLLPILKKAKCQNVKSLAGTHRTDRTTVRLIDAAHAAVVEIDDPRAVSPIGVGST